MMKYCIIFVLMWSTFNLNSLSFHIPSNFINKRHKSIAKNHNLTFDIINENKNPFNNFLNYSGGFGNFQLFLFLKLGFTYGFIGIDTLFSAFLTPALANVWNLTILQQGYISASWFAGGIFGYILAAFFNNKVGPKQLLLLFSFIRTITTLTLFLNNQFSSMLLILRFLSSASAAISFNSLLALMFEYAPDTYTALCKQGLSLMWNGGLIYMSLIVFLLRDYSWHRMVFIFLPMIVSTLWLVQNIPESMSYLLAKGKVAEAKQIMCDISASNQVPINNIPNEIINDVLQIGIQHQTQHLPDDIKNNITPKNPLVIDPDFVQAEFQGEVDLYPRKIYPVYTDGLKPMIINSILICIINFSITLAYYGLALGLDPSTPVSSTASKAASTTSICYAQFSAAVAEIPVLLLIAPMADNLGRRTSMTIFLSVFAGSLVTMSLLSSYRHILSMNYPALKTTIKQLIFMFMLLARASGHGASTLKWVINAEAYPVSKRNLGLAIASLSGQTGGLLGPLLLPLFKTSLALATMFVPSLLLLSCVALWGLGGVV